VGNTKRSVPDQEQRILSRKCFTYNFNIFYNAINNARQNAEWLVNKSACHIFLSYSLHGKSKESVCS